MSSNPYNILEISPTASQEEIKRSYKSLALKWHPDKNKNNPEEANEKFRAISDAYQILGDENRRKMFDSRGVGGSSSEPFFASDFHSNFGRGGFHDPFELFRSFFGDSNMHPNDDLFFQSPRFPVPFGQSPFGGGVFGQSPFGGGVFGQSSFANSSSNANFYSKSSSTVIRNGVRTTTTTVTQNGETQTTKETFDSSGTLISRTIESNGSSNNRISNN